LVLHRTSQRLSAIIDELEALVEVRPLSTQEIELKSQSNAQIANLLREEELKWYQYSKSQFIFEGDSNTRYFHSVANGRHRKKHIHSLVQEEGTIEGQEQLKVYITNYYKNLFGDPDEENFTMNEAKIEDIPQVSPQETGLLTAPYTEEEVKKGDFPYGTQQASRSGWFSSRVLSNFLGHHQGRPDGYVQLSSCRSTRVVSVEFW
jgi:hypothetical protein